MGLDLEMCIVPHEFENILSKAQTNSDYAEWISSVQRILSNEDFSTYDNALIKEFQSDVLNLKNFHEYDGEDFFEDQGRESSTLDYILDRYIDEYGLDSPYRILWQGGERCEGCQSGQGMTLTLYKSIEIERINSFFQMLSEEDILNIYDYEAMSEEGVYKLTYPDNKYILAESFSNLKSLFQRALLNDAYILRNIY